MSGPEVKVHEFQDGIGPYWAVAVYPVNMKTVWTSAIYDEATAEEFADIIKKGVSK